MSIKYALHYSHISFSFLKGETKEFSTNGRDNKFEALKVLIRNCKPDREMIEIPLTDCEFCKYSGLLEAIWNISIFLAFGNNDSLITNS